MWMVNLLCYADLFKVSFTLLVSCTNNCYCNILDGLAQLISMGLS